MKRQQQDSNPSPSKKCTVSGYLSKISPMKGAGVNYFDGRLQTGSAPGEDARIVGFNRSILNELRTLQDNQTAVKLTGVRQEVHIHI